MSDDKGGEAATIETEVKAATDAALSSDKPAAGDEKTVERDYETEAKDMGWRPKEEWTGDPAKWKDAETYVSDGDRINRITDAKLAKAEKAFNDRLARVEKTSAKAIENLKAVHAKQIAELTTERRTAIKAADVTEVERIDKEIEALKDAGPEVEPAEDAVEIQNEWISKQDWWNVDEDMTAYAIGISQNILAKNPKITMTENLEKTTEALKKKYPLKFGGKTGTNGHAPVDGGGDFPGSRRAKGKTAADVPEADRAIGHQLVKSGAFKDIEAYAKEYFNA